ncbi:MAG TPA: GSCFA domain-containing protein [Rhizomicrobium sp.]|nr:GSCFA domain-containing protein [Rhizomicrobium sp.]
MNRVRQRLEAMVRAIKKKEGAPSAKRHFHRGDVINYYPDRDQLKSDDFLGQFLLKGWVPEEPVLNKGVKITAFGSCFAANITRHLSSIGFDLSSDRDSGIYISRMGDAMVNTPSILGQFEWAFENKDPAEHLWYGKETERYRYDDEVRQRTRKVFLDTEFFIITLGLSEVWYDARTGGTFWRGVPEHAFDPDRHKFRVLSVAETKADIARMHALIRQFVPQAKLLFTVSPIPLAATFRNVSCITANTVSKAVIRSALDEFLREHEDEINKTLFYFPSMELVQFGFTDPWGNDWRHPENYILDTVMKVFEAAYCSGGCSMEEAIQTFNLFREKNLVMVLQKLKRGPENRELINTANRARRQAEAARQKAKARQSRVGDADEGPEQKAASGARAAKKARRQKKRLDMERARDPDAD